MVKTIFEFGKRLVSSQFGLFLLVIHLIILVYRFIPRTLINSEKTCNLEFRSPGWIYIAGDYFHFAYENILMQTVLLLDLPVLIIAESIVNLFSYLNWCDFTKSWVIAGLSLIFASLQWLLVGLGLQEFYRLLKNLK